MVAFALGVMPGTDMVAAADVIAGETGDVRAIPRLPARADDPAGILHCGSCTAENRCVQLLLAARDTNHLITVNNLHTITRLDLCIL